MQHEFLDKDDTCKFCNKTCQTMRKNKKWGEKNPLGLGIERHEKAWKAWKRKSEEGKKNERNKKECQLLLEETVTGQKPQTKAFHNPALS